MDGNTCCIYFCTGLSMFGVVCLIFMGVILSSGGEWYLGVAEDDASAAAASCYVAASIYGFYVVCCGMRMKNLNAVSKMQLADEPDV